MNHSTSPAPVNAQPRPGRCWVLGDDINTDYLAPGKYMKFGIEDIARHCLEDVLPHFAAEVRAGDLIIAGRNFGTGSSREQAVSCLKGWELTIVVARSFAGLFYRNGFNLGLPLLLGPADMPAPAWGIAPGTPAVLDLAQARLQLPDARQLSCQPIPTHLLALVADGGLVPHLRRRIERQRPQHTSTAP